MPHCAHEWQQLSKKVSGALIAIEQLWLRPLPARFIGKPEDAERALLCEWRHSTMWTFILLLFWGECKSVSAELRRCSRVGSATAWSHREPWGACCTRKVTCKREGVQAVPLPLSAIASTPVKPLGDGCAHWVKWVEGGARRGYQPSSPNLVKQKELVS